MSEIGGSSKFRCWAKMSMKQTRKIGLQRIQLLSSRTPRIGKRTCQALELLNSDVRDRNTLEMTMLGQYEHETNTKNRTSTNSAFELTNTLEMVEKTCQALESLNSDVRDSN